MNQRLVESVAQIILAMSEDERRLLERKLQHANLPQLKESEAAEKSLRIAEIAQDIQDFEELYHAPLSDLPAEYWGATDQMPPAHASFARTQHAPVKSDQNGALSTKKGAATESAITQGSASTQNSAEADDLTVEADDLTAEEANPPQSFFQPTSLFQFDSSADDDDMSYVFYEAPGHDGQS
ncbi:MAG: hypothetical protein AAF810_13525 [Cyanobacteria bacterium P01_D01_bin.36]